MCHQITPDTIQCLAHLIFYGIYRNIEFTGNFIVALILITGHIVDQPASWGQRMNRQMADPFIIFLDKFCVTEFLDPLVVIKNFFCQCLVVGSFFQEIKAKISCNGENKGFKR